MGQNYSWPSASSITIAAEGANGAPAPTQSLEIGGINPGGNLQPLLTDASGNLLVSLAAGPISPPLNVNLADVGGAVISLGQKLSSASVPVVIASDQSTLNVSDAITHTDLSAISAQLPATLGAHITSASLAVNIASDQVVPVSASSLPLPTGAATDSNQSLQLAQETAAASSVSSIDSKTPALGQALMAASVPVAIASDQSPIPVSISSGISNPLPVSDATTHTDLDTINTTLGSPFQAGGSIGNTSFQATQPTASALNATVVQATGSNLHVQVDAGSAIIGSVSIDQTTPGTTNGVQVNAALPAGTNNIGKVITAGNVPLQFVRNDYSSVNVTTAAYVQLIASTSGVSNILEIFDSSGQTLKIAFGAAASEVDQFIVYPGGNGRMTVTIPAATRISVKALSATASSGEIDLNLYV